MSFGIISGYLGRRERKRAESGAGVGQGQAQGEEGEEYSGPTDHKHVHTGAGGSHLHMDTWTQRLRLDIEQKPCSRLWRYSDGCDQRPALRRLVGNTPTNKHTMNEDDSVLKL